MNDPIVEEVRRHRAAIATRNGNDLRRIFEDARTREGQDGRRLISFDTTVQGSSGNVLREEPPAS
jgi:hypothetical protein